MRRTIERILLVGFLVAALASIAHAAGDTVKIDNPPFLPGESAAQCYADAVDNLNHGTWFERAIIQLKEAIRQDPNNESYHLALGCAYADRAASIAYAAGFAAVYKQATDGYAKSLAAWQKAQADPTSKQYGKPAPLPPPAFRSYTKDDWSWFTLTPDQTTAQLSGLAKEAQAELTSAIALAGSPADRANAEYVEGWALQMLANCQELSDEAASPNAAGGIVVHHSISGIPSHDDIVKAFTAATKDSPGVAVCWESLGDSLRQSGWSSFDSKTMAAFRQALALDPKNSSLWYVVALSEAGSDPKMAATDLSNEIAADQTNAFPMYLLADFELRQTHYIHNSLEDPADPNDPNGKMKLDQAMAATLNEQDRSLAGDAIRLVEQGNDAAFCRVPLYHPPVPRMLLAAFDYTYKRNAVPFTSYPDVHTLAYDLCGYANVTAMAGDLDSAFRADNDIIEMGKHVMGQWSTNLDELSGQTMGLLTGFIIAHLGYGNMRDIASLYGDPDMADAIQSELDSFNDAFAQWRKTEQETNAFQNNEYADY